MFKFVAAFWLMTISLTGLIPTATYADSDLSKVAEVRVSNKGIFQLLTPWYLKLSSGLNIKKIVFDENVKDGASYFDSSGKIIIFSPEEMKKIEYKLSKNDKEYLQLYKQGSSIFSNFFKVKDLQDFPVKNDGKIRIYIAGAEWCGACKLSAGMFLKTFGNKQVVEIVYIDFTLSVKNSPIIDNGSSSFLLHRAARNGYIPAVVSFPTFIVEKSGKMLSVVERDEEMLNLVNSNLK